VLPFLFQDGGGRRAWRRGPAGFSGGGTPQSADEVRRKKVLKGRVATCGTAVSRQRTGRGARVTPRGRAGSGPGRAVRLSGDVVCEENRTIIRLYCFDRYQCMVGTGKGAVHASASTATATD
jgi:hypothetical protein